MPVIKHSQPLSLKIQYSTKIRFKGKIMLFKAQYTKISF